MRNAILGVSLLIGGCASGKLLEINAIPDSSSSHISAPAGVLLRIKPLHSSGDGTSLNRQQDSNLWLAKGWYTVDFNCSALKKDGEVIAISISEYTTSRNIRIAGGHSYSLACDSKTLDVLRLKNVGVAPNYAIKGTSA